MFSERLSRLTGLFLPKAVNRRIQEESEFHLEMLTAKYREQGCDEKEARLRARREFGGITQMQDEFRDQSSLPWLDALRGDLRFAVRSFSKTPGVTVLIVLMLALGIGANTAIFSFLNELLLRPLPFQNAKSLVAIGRLWDGQVGAVTPREFVLIRDQARSFESVGITFIYRGENIETPSVAQHVSGLQVSEGYFRTLSMEPIVGRKFQPEEDVPNGPKVVVLSASLWQTSFRADPNIAGTTVKIGGVPHTVVGVMPDQRPSRARLWMPLQNKGTGNDNNYAMVGRLKDGATPQRASADVDALLRQVDEDKTRHRQAAVVPMQESETFEFRRPVLLLYAAVCVVLVVACLNAANLLLARSASRGREIAMRAALGAGRGRILRQMLTESVMLAAVGCLAGLGLAYWFIWILKELAPYDSLQHVRLDRMTLLFTAGVSFVAGVAFGIAPAVHSLRLDLIETLKATSSKSSAGSSTLRGRQALVIGQVAMCMVLLAVAGLLVRTLINLRAVDLGFEPKNVITAPMALNRDKLASTESLAAFYTQALDRARTIPGVAAVGITTQLPVEGQFNLGMRLPDSAEPERGRSVQVRVQTHDTFQVLGMRIVRGRDFRDTDSAGAPLVAVVNEAFLMRYFPGQEALGLRVALFPGPVPFTIAGVINDVREMGLKSQLPPTVYLHAAQAPVRILRTIHAFLPAKWVIKVQPGSEALVAEQLRHAVGQLDAAQPVQEFRPMTAVIARTMSMERFLGTLLAAFALLTLVMAASGLYGTLSYGVQQRRQEIGIRLALGAQAANIAGSVMGSGAMLIGSGLLIGLGVSYWVTKLMAGFPFELKPLDPVSLASAGLILMVVGVLASAGPSV